MLAGARATPNPRATHRRRPRGRATSDRKLLGCDDALALAAQSLHIFTERRIVAHHDARGVPGCADLPRAPARRGGVPSDVLSPPASWTTTTRAPAPRRARWTRPSRASASGGRSASAAAAAPTHRVVVGAGVAGVCCAEELARLRPDDVVTLVALGDAVQSVRDVERVTRKTRLLDVVDRPASSLERANLRVLRAEATALDPDAKTLHVRPHAPSGEPPNADARAALRYDQPPASAREPSP